MTHKILTILMCFGALALGLAACGDDAAPDTPPQTAPSIPSPTYHPDTLAEGQANYGIYCVACHGPQARGLDGLGPGLRENAFLAERDDEAVLQFLIQGRPADHPQNVSGVAMPARGGYPNLADDDLRTIIAYLRALDD
ncbi:MAG: c-type cytochrome [Anaerolineales bacterium]